MELIYITKTLVINPNEFKSLRVSKIKPSRNGDVIWQVVIKYSDEKQVLFGHKSLDIVETAYHEYLNVLVSDTYVKDLSAVTSKMIKMVQEYQEK